MADMVKILAKMFRNVLDSDKKNYTVNDELDNIRSYICLQNIRFDNVITLHEDVDQKLCRHVSCRFCSSRSLKIHSNTEAERVVYRSKYLYQEDWLMNILWCLPFRMMVPVCPVRDWKKYDTAWRHCRKHHRARNTKLSSNRSSQYSRADQIALWK